MWICSRAPSSGTLEICVSWEACAQPPVAPKARRLMCGGDRLGFAGIRRRAWFTEASSPAQGAGRLTGGRRRAAAGGSATAGRRGRASGRTGEAGGRCLVEARRLALLLTSAYSSRAPTRFVRTEPRPTWRRVLLFECMSALSDAGLAWGRLVIGTHHLLYGPVGACGRFAGRSPLVRGAISGSLAADGGSCCRPSNWRRRLILAVPRAEHPIHHTGLIGGLRRQHTCMPSRSRFWRHTFLASHQRDFRYNVSPW